MKHDPIRRLLEYVMATEKVRVSIGALHALLEDRDQLAAENEARRVVIDEQLPEIIRQLAELGEQVKAKWPVGERGNAVIPPVWVQKEGIEGLVPFKMVSGQYGPIDEGDGAGIVPNGQPAAPQVPNAKGDAGSCRPAACCDCYPWCDCDEVSNEPEQPDTNVTVEGGWDTQDGDEMVTVNLNPSEQGAVDAILVQVSESGEITGPVEVLAKDIERAVCGSRQPPSQEAEMVAAMPSRGFVEDRKDEASGAKVVPWKASYTPDKCLLAIRMLSDGNAVVSAAAAAGLEKITVSDISKQYRKQIDLAAEMGAGEREQFFGSMYRQMLARWAAAGNDPAVQPSGQPKKKVAK
ncbi:MAG: hypothetical protein K1X67_07915 [Fimbriimonadaceae bacterium]|nr:hypothetical protein [Fimbriimonadaceae bacterium]